MTTIANLILLFSSAYQLGLTEIEGQFLEVCFTTQLSKKKLEISQKLNTHQEDCVFNNNYKELTEEWLTESGISKFVWDDSLKHAKFSRKKDTIFLTQGGCNHFGYTVEQRIYSDKLDTDIEHWVNLAIGLSDKFDFKHYEKSLRAKEFSKPTNTNNPFWIDIKDDYLDDNLFYSGVEVRINSEYKAILISKYFN